MNTITKLAVYCIMSLTFAMGQAQEKSIDST
jgi:hypothetical protein